METQPTEIFVKSNCSPQCTINYCAKLILNDKLPTIKLKAIGGSVIHALTIADVLTKRIFGLSAIYQINNTKNKKLSVVVDKKEKEECKNHDLDEEMISVLEVILTLEGEKFTECIGFHPPLKKENVDEFGETFEAKLSNIKIGFIIISFD